MTLILTLILPRGALLLQATQNMPASGQAPKAQASRSTGAMRKSEGLGCVGCHK